MAVFVGYSMPVIKCLTKIESIGRGDAPVRNFLECKFFELAKFFMSPENKSSKNQLPIS
jgi:hypothetical protein